MTRFEVARWTLALLVALGLGHAVTSRFVRFLRRDLPGDVHAGAVGIPVWVTGLTERLFFTVAVAVDLSGTAIAMITWLFAKMGANWGREAGSPTAPFALSALLGGLVSMFFALVGGLLIRYPVPETIVALLDPALGWWLEKGGLILNLIGALMVAFAFGPNPGGAHQKGISLASFLHPWLFTWGLVILMVGFFLQLLG